jgi:hypothetical protein
MEMVQVSPGVTAFVHPEGRSSCGMIHTAEVVYRQLKKQSG